MAEMTQSALMATLILDVHKSCRTELSLCKNTSADIVFDPNTPVTKNQHSVLANRTNKLWLIEQLKERLISEGVVCCQSQADAGNLICSTTLDFAYTNARLVVLVGKYTDHRATTDNIYMQYSRESVYNLESIQQKMAPQTWQDILIAYAVTGVIPHLRCTTLLLTC